MKYHGIIFDFNGVLLWDTHLHEQAWIEFSQGLRGDPFTSEELHTHGHGKTNKVILEYLMGRAISPEELRALSLQKESIYQNLCLEDPNTFQLSPGAIELLDFLVKNEIPHTIATASDTNNLDFFIQHLRLETWFDLSKIVHDDGTYSGKREMYLKAAENLQLQPQQCIVIEDSKSGILAANLANIGKIVGLGPIHTHQQLHGIEGVSEAIASLAQIEKSEIFFIPWRPKLKVLGRKQLPCAQKGR